MVPRAPPLSYISPPSLRFSDTDLQPVSGWRRHSKGNLSPPSPPYSSRFSSNSPLNRIQPLSFPYTLVSHGHTVRLILNPYLFLLPLRRLSPKEKVALMRGSFSSFLSNSLFFAGISSFFSLFFYFLFGTWPVTFLDAAVRAAPLLFPPFGFTSTFASFRLRTRALFLSPLPYEFLHKLPPPPLPDNPAFF